ncbi:ASPIC/UnbV domain protein [Candidatus Sulfopaludibacter sp. SbA6]|nr:ASPIC/UnbV domain protein [Candidatus Sulfopaludibacter sp. SbA6]
MRTLIWIAVVVSIVLAAPVAGPIVFEETAGRSGLDFLSNSSPTANKNQPETMVAGVALLDYDNDGFLDVYFVNGAAIPSLNKEGPAYWNRLYHNNHDGTFTDVTARAGVAGAGYGMGAAAGDYDNDGWPDLYVVNVTKNQLFHNNHDGTFSDVTDKAGVGGGVLDGKKMWSVSALWLDYNNDGLPDLFVSNYCKWEVNQDPFCGPKPEARTYCHPKNYAPLPNTLYRNNGDGTFTDVSAETGLSKHYGRGMGAVMADYDGDGFMDIFVANDNHPNFLFHNIAGKRFEEVAFESGVAYPESANAISGMGADFKDVNNDGRPDLWHTAIENESFPLYLNQGGGGFSEITDKSLLTKTRTMSGWSNGIFDFDNDGWKDLFVARGNVLDNVAMFSNRRYEEPNSVFRNRGRGGFQEVSAEAGADFQKAAAHRGAAFGDIDNDGRIDAVVSVLNGRAEYFHNVSRNANHWILLKLAGTKSNRMGLGAQIRVTGEDGSKQYNEVTTAVGYACSSDSRVHFGLGASKTIREIEIKWPSGIRQILRNVAVDQILSIEERAAAP